MRNFYVRRKDLDHVPFQYYISPDGVEQRLENGYTGVFTISPSRGNIDTVYVRIVEEFAQEVMDLLKVSRADLIRLAAKGVEAWLKGEPPIPADHHYGPEWLKMDRDWYPRDPGGSPSMMANPYTFEVVTDEPWPSILDWDFNKPRGDESEVVTTPAMSEPRIVFGFTLDIFPAALILGFEQLRKRIAEAGLKYKVEMSLLNELPSEMVMLFVPRELAGSARQLFSGDKVQALDDLVNNSAYDKLVEQLKGERTLSGGEKIS